MNPLIPALISTVLDAIQSSGTAPPQVVAPSLRTIPAEARRAEMQPPITEKVTLGGKAFRLSPGAQIRTARNTIVLPAYVQQRALVRYLTDADGAVTRIWMLAPDEAARPDPK